PPFGGTPTPTFTGTPPTATSTNTPRPTNTSFPTATPTVPRSPTSTMTPTATSTPLGCGASQPLAEGFESGTLGAFTAATTLGTFQWAVTSDVANTGAYSAHVLDPNEQSDQQLATTNAISIPASATQAQLHFAHRFSFESPDFDGGVLEVSL